MDSRIPRIRSKLAKMPYQAHRSHSACEERHQFRLGPRINSSEADAFETEHHIVLPAAYRAFLIELGGSGAGPFYGLLPLDECRLFTMNRQPSDGSPRGFTHVDHPDALQGDLFLHVIEMGCSDLCLIAVTGPLVGRVVTGNADGFWPPNVSSAQDFLSWYERWLNHMREGKDNAALGADLPSNHREHPMGPPGHSPERSAFACPGSLMERRPREPPEPRTPGEHITSYSRGT